MCSSDLSLIGGKWKLRILWHIVHGDNRFSLLKKALPEVTEKVLYTTLRELESMGLIYKEVRSSKKPAVIIYHIEDKHVKLKEVIDVICEFKREYAKVNEIEVKQ